MNYKAQIFDRLQYLFDTTGYNDHQVHCVISFENKIDAVMMEKAVQLLVEAIPMLSRVYRNAGGRSYWEDAGRINRGELFTIVTRKEDFDRFTSSKTNEASGPQIRVCLLQSDEDALSVIINHMVSDAAGFKQCIYLLADIYSNLVKNPEYRPEYIIDGDRGFKSIVDKISLPAKMKLLFFGSKDNNQKTGCQFPFSSDSESVPAIIVHELPQERYYEIRDFCRKNCVTVNDVLLAAYFRAVSGMLGMNGKKLDISFMIDMRRYLEDKSFHSLTNLSSTSTVGIAVFPHENFNQTLFRVGSEMNRKKSNDLGMNTFLKLDTLFKLTHAFGYRILERSLNNPKIGMTNIGVLDSSRLAFGNSTVSNAFMCGSIKYRPHFQMSVSSFNDKMTFCVNLYGSREDREAIDKFFGLMDRELESL